MDKKADSAVSTALSTKLLINNQDVDGSGEWLRVVNPATEELVAEFRGASPAQVEAAVMAAKRAFQRPDWQDPVLRRKVLLAFADLIEAQRDALMEALIEEIGSPVNLKSNHIDTPVAFLRWFAEQATQDRTRHLGFNAAHTGVSTVAYRPVGVVAAITAFNYPLLIGLTKIGAALAMGCTTVLLSSPQAPMAVMLLNALVRRAGFPEGVVNLLAGAADVGRALTSHPDVDKVSFTGSVGVGQSVLQQASQGLRGAVLELGGKSAAILLPGVNYQQYAFSLHARYARNAGQGCGSPTRILIEESRYAEFIAASREVYPRITVGDPRDPATIVGPVVSAAQRERIEAMLARATAQGGMIVAGGGRPALRKGWFINPALVGGLDNQSELAREEVFGPVSVVLTYRSVEQAVQIANDSQLGLKAYLFGSKDECLRLVPQLRVGTVQINGGSPLRPDAPMTGCKLSGLGSEWGLDGLREFLVPQHIDCAV
jgi:aldehyde dehydrogenase (NAD+)/betaine-aldehyde dehydrogenase